MNPILHPSRRIATYSNAILRWTLAENAGVGLISFLNTGTYSGHPMAIKATGDLAVTTGHRGVLGRCCRFNGARTTQRSHIATADPSTTPTVSDQCLTMSCWVIMRQLNATATCVVFGKDRNTSTTNAHSADTLALQISTTGALRVVCTTGTAGSGTQTITAATSLLKENVPYLIAATYDGVNMRGYVNGDCVLNTAKTGNLDWGTDNSNKGGPWYVGGPRTTNAAQDNQMFDGTVEECVVETAVVSEMQLRARYFRGMALYAQDAA